MYKRDKIILIIIIIPLFITCFLYDDNGLILDENPYLRNYTILTTHSGFTLNPDYFNFYRHRMQNDYPGDYQDLIYYSYSNFCLDAEWQALEEKIAPHDVYGYLTHHSRMGINHEAVCTTIDHDYSTLCEFYNKLPYWQTYAHLPQSTAYVPSNHEKQDSYLTTGSGHSILFSGLITALSHSYPDQASLSKSMFDNLTPAHIYEQDKTLFICVLNDPNIKEKSPFDSGSRLTRLFSPICIPIYSDIGGQGVCMTQSSFTYSNATHLTFRADIVAVVGQVIVTPVL